MTCHLLADAVLLIHLTFILFVALGALLVCRFPRLVWLHLPAVIWGGMIEITGKTCPLTPLENHLLASSGEASYSGGFIEHYLLSFIYPHDLSRPLQIGLGVGAMAINALAYVVMYRRARGHGRKSGPRNAK